MKTMTALGILFLVAGCGSHTERHGESRSPLGDESPETEQPAAEVPSAEGPGETAGDGRPDDLTSDPNDTIDPADDGVVCALFVEESDGACTREASDPCISQDPDCVNPAADDSDSLIDCPEVVEVDGVCDPGNLCGPDPDCESGGGFAACEEYIEEPDDVCRRGEGDPCMFQDPDCVHPAADDSDSLIDCSATPNFDGVCDTSNICGNDPDCPHPAADDSDSLIDCPEKPEVDGVCVPGDICGDPDCTDDGGGDGLVACAEYIEEPDGTCSRHETDPCLFQDPDCIQPMPGSGSGLTRCMPNPPSDGVCDPSGECTPFDPDCEGHEDLPIETL